MSDESVKTLNNVASDLIKSRISHPILGTFIFSFLITYWDLIIIFLSDLNFDSEFAVNSFKSDFISNRYRIFYPIISSLLIPVIEPIYNSYYQRIIAFWRLRTESKVNKEANEFAAIRLPMIEAINSELMSKSSTMKSQFSLLVNSYLEYLRLTKPDYTFVLVQSSDNLKVGDFVGEMSAFSIFGKFSRGKYPKMLGIAEFVLGEHLLIVKVINTFEDLYEVKRFAPPTNAESNLEFDPYSFSLLDTKSPSNSDYVIAKYISPNKWVTLIEFANGKIDDKFQNLLLGKIFEQLNLPEKRIKMKRFDRMKKAFKIIMDN